MKGLVNPKFKITDRSLEELSSAGIPEEILRRLADLKDQEVRRRGKFVALLQQRIGYRETALYQKVILRAAAIKRQRRGPRKKPWWRRLKRPALWPWVWKIVQSTILGAVIFLALFGLDWLTSFLTRMLSAASGNHTADLIKSVKNAATLGMFMVFLVVKVVHNLIGMIEE